MHSCPRWQFQEILLSNFLGTNKHLSGLPFRSAVPEEYTAQAEFLHVRYLYLHFIGSASFKKIALSTTPQ